MSTLQSEILMAEIVALCTQDHEIPQGAKHIHASNLSPVSCLKSTRAPPLHSKAVRFVLSTSEGNALALPKPSFDESEAKYRAAIRKLNDAAQMVSRLQTSTLLGELFEPEDQDVVLQYLEHRLEKLQIHLELYKANFKMVALDRKLSEIDQYLLRGKKSLNYTPEAWNKRSMDKWKAFPENERVDIEYQTPEVYEALLLEKREVKFKFEDLDRRNHLLGAKLKQNREVENNLEEVVAASWKRFDVSLELRASL